MTSLEGSNPNQLDYSCVDFPNFSLIYNHDVVKTFNDDGGERYSDNVSLKASETHSGNLPSLFSPSVISLKMVSGPIFHSSSDLAIWKRLSRSGTGKFSLGRKGSSSESIANEVMTSTGTVSSAILVRLLDTLYDAGSERLRSIMPDIVAKRRIMDSAPALEAALLYLKMDDIDAAETMLETARDTQDIPRKSIVRARLLLEREDRTTARKVLMQGRCSDPLNQRIYKLLEEVDPAGEWMYRRNIELLYAERNTVACGTSDEDTPQQKLYRIYCEWYSGNHDEATEALINSPEYAEKDTEFMLAAARMSADESDWYSAEILYDGLKDLGCLYVICEAARVSFHQGKVDKALELYTQAEAIDPRSPMVMEGKIEVYSKTGHKDDAASYIMAYLDNEDADLDDYLRYSRLLVDDAMNANAEPIIKKILMNYPENVEANILLSKNDIAIGNFSAALDAANSAVKHGGREKEPRLQRAKVLFAIGRYDRAMKDAQNVLTTDPDDIEALILAKDVYLIQGKKQKAVGMFDRILELDPDNAQIILEYSEVKMSKGDAEGSLASFRRAIRADPRPENFIMVIKSLIEDGRYEEAINLCEEKESEYGNIATVRRLRGNAEFAMGEYLKSSVSFAAAAALDPHSPEIWHSKGMADEAAGDLDSAEDAYNRTVLMDLDNPEYWISKATVQEKMNDFHGAVESLNRVIELKPDSAYALVKKAMIFARKGKFRESLFFIDMALMVNNWNKEIYNIKKEICIHTGRYEEAINVCSQISALDPKDVYAITDAADCMMKVGDRSSALSLVNLKLSKDPNSLPLLFSMKSILTSMGDYSKLIEVCYRILEKDPGNRLVKMDLAQAYADNGDMVSADRIRTELYNDDAALEPVTAVPIESDKTESPEGEGSEVEEPEEEDDEALFDIARSLYSAGDIRGAARMAERALELEPGKTEYVLFRAEIYLANDDTRGAAAAVKEGLRHSGEDPGLWEKDGDLRAELEDHYGAADSYQNAIMYGNGSSTIYVKRGDVRMNVGDLDGAVSDYAMAVSKAGMDNLPRVRLASAYCIGGNLDDADKVIDTVLSDEPENSEAIVVKAKIYSERNDSEGVMRMYRHLLMTHDPEADILKEMSSILAEQGFHQESSILSMRAARYYEEDETPEEIIRNAERLLRRAYVSKRSLDDPGIENMLEVDQEVADAVMRYLSNIKEYGPIVPGTPEFLRMESLSYYAVTRAGLVDVDKEPIITIPSAFVAGGAKDADEAKELVAYIFEALDGTIMPDLLSEDVKPIASDRVADMSIYDIMKEFKLGAYSARAIKGLSSSASETS